MDKEKRETMQSNSILCDSLGFNNCRPMLRSFLWLYAVCSWHANVLVMQSMPKNPN